MIVVRYSWNLLIILSHVIQLEECRATGLGQTGQAPRFNGRLPGKNFDYTPCIESHLIYCYHSPSSSVPDQRFLCQVCHWRGIGLRQWVIRDQQGGIDRS